MKQEKEITSKDAVKFIVFAVIAAILMFSLNNINTSIKEIKRDIVQVIIVDSIVISRLDTLEVRADSLIKIGNRIEFDSYEAKDKIRRF